VSNEGGDMNAETLIFDNGVRPRRKPALSVLIPFFRNDPTRLVAGLGRLGTPLEVVVLDNGSGDAALADRLTAAILRLRLPARLVRLSARTGRATARNRLALEARAERRLFLDVEAAQDDDRLRRAFELVRRAGLEASRTPATPRGGRRSGFAPSQPAVSLSY
jgi:hypothetical protein